MYEKRKHGLRSRAGAPNSCYRILVIELQCSTLVRLESPEELLKCTDSVASQLERLIQLVRGKALALLLFKKIFPVPDDFNL